ncbi:helicase-exonuclease AddAB subunit AddA [Oribacterium sp. WCC10]|uniref:helicase-exonuclease AddAB subunit AddA n=1 Tax=Oribacterium sp. WCC10 TaxID=1855343 RepID=UPI0008E57AAD|nr:helicase-exonuclease AddAB subunit AddA [Oribacterium sp. WCC10]SFG81787.1 DNA helicase/exodeoxyribonuclease V, subunit A [Oribacterium sp. WCC10]
MKWTDDQQKVISHKEGNLLVAAAAGSGKTAVLVEHVISRITDKADPVSLDDMVIMTFTDAAAQEMRERIKMAIDEQLSLHPDDAGLIREAGNIQNANISTIDSFCKRLITENYAVIDLDPGFRIGDSGELKLLKSDIIADLLEEHYAEENNYDFLNFVDTFASGQADGGIEELILRLHEHAEANPWPMEYLDRCLDDEGEEGWKKFYLSSLLSRVSDDADSMEYALSLCEDPDGPDVYIDEFTANLEAIDRVKEAKSLSELSQSIKEINYGRLKPSKACLKDKAKNIRDAVKKDLKAIDESLIILDKQTEKNMEEGIHAGIRVLISLTKEFIERFQEQKARRHMLDFGDLEHKALEILYVTDEDGTRHFSAIADDYARHYREILVDEYQDSNYVQEELISALSAQRFGRPDVFQVGDVKQSIYSFRQARPDLFLAKYNDINYPTIELSQNFRSRNEVISAANDVFKSVMTAAVGGIDYTEKAALHYGFNGAPYSKQLEKEYETELLLMENDQDLSRELFDGEDLGKEEAEARMIAARIHELHDREEQTPYRDIVILTRSPGSWADTIVDVLNEEGIPAYCTSNEGYFNTVEVETILAMLDVIDNPQQDIPIAAIMHSAIYDFSDEEMAEIVAARGTLRPLTEVYVESATDSVEKHQDNAAEIYGIYRRSAENPDETGEKEWKSLRDDLADKLLDFYCDIEKYRQMSRYLSIHELLYRIYDDTGYYNYVTAMPSGSRRKANLDALVDMALSFESTSYKGLFDYIRYIEKLKKYDNDQGEASIYSDQDDLVRIMSIHKSKGLQFPVVFLSGMGRNFNRQDLNAKILVDSEYGIGCNYVDLVNKVRIPSLKRAAIREKLETDQLGEELRILYVGMTRAVHKLILTASSNNVEKLLEKYADGSTEVTTTSIKGASCYLDWILMAEGRLKLEGTGKAREENAPIALKMYSLSDIHRMMTDREDSLMEQQKSLVRQIADVDITTPLYKEVLDRFSFAYAHEAATGLYPKHSVSELKQAEIEKLELDKKPNEIMPWNISIDISDDEIAAHPNKSFSFPPSACNSEKTGADVGDAYHHAFERYDYSDDPINFMDQLRSKLNEAELKLIREDRFKAFLDGDLAGRFRLADSKGLLFRESHFMLSLPHNELFESSGITEGILLQGIIDAYFIEDDEIVLVDYKTDRVRESVILVERYRKQLELYARALESITGKRVKEKLIYSVMLEETIAL